LQIHHKILHYNSYISLTKLGADVSVATRDVPLLGGASAIPSKVVDKSNIKSCLA